MRALSGRTKGKDERGVGHVKRNAYSVLFTPAMALITALMKGHAEGRPDERLTRYAKPKLLIVDEFGYLPLGPHAAHLFFALASRRYERGSLLVPSNRSVSEWGYGPERSAWQAGQRTGGIAMEFVAESSN